MFVEVTGEKLVRGAFPAPPSLLPIRNRVKNIFLENSIYKAFKRNRNLKEILSPSLYTKNKNEKKSYVIKICGKCDICKNYFISDNTFTCKVTILVVIV